MTSQLPRSLTGNRLLLPAVRPGISKNYLSELPRYTASQWTFGHGSVIWTIWPAVLIHTLFAAVVAVVSEETSLHLQIPSLMLTVLGVVIGFVISYRAISGYERYWTGRSIWTNIMKNARTMSRLIHIHVPPRISPKTSAGKSRELGIYYEDLYDLVRPLHEHEHDEDDGHSAIRHVAASTGPTYGATLKHAQRRPSVQSEESQPLLPAQSQSDQTDLKHAQNRLTPFGLGSFFSRMFGHGLVVQEDAPERKSHHRWQGPLRPKIGQAKGAPRETGSGENLPLEVLRCLSEWCSVLEDRRVVPGSSLGGIMGCISVFEGSLTSLEMILSTPLPFVYAAHIRHTVWIYLFLLPFQLVSSFGYYSILGVAIASFIYLGFIAAGEEIEQPFGYDENDLDLDLFCREVISDEIEVLKRTPGLNVATTQIPSSSTPSLAPPPEMFRRSVTLVSQLYE